MAYIGVSPSNGVRKKHTYTATASQTSFSGAGDEGITLAYRDSNYVDVYQNGVKLADEDYTATSGTAIVLAQGASADDIVEIIAFDVFSVADTVSKADGGTFDGNVTMAGTLGVTGDITLSNIAGGAVFNEAGADVDFRVESDTSTHALFVDGANGNVGIGTASPSSFGKFAIRGSETIATYGETSAHFSDATTGSMYITHASNNISLKTDGDLGLFANNADSVIISTNATERMRIDATGAVTMPNQPAFLVQPASAQSNIAINTVVTVAFGTEIFDQNADFASNTFTAPVTGKYQFSVALYLQGIDTGASSIEFALITSNRTYSVVLDPNFSADLDYFPFTFSILADMDASDTTTFTINQGGGNAQLDITAGKFSGFLAC
jgi:hypothetical protein